MSLGPLIEHNNLWVKNGDFEVKPSNWSHLVMHVYTVYIYIYVYNRYCKLLWHLDTIFEIYTTLISYLVKNGFCPPCFPQAAGTPNPHFGQTSKASFYMPWEVTLVTTFRLLKELEPTNLEWANLVQAVVIYVFAPPKWGRTWWHAFKKLDSKKV